MEAVVALSDIELIELREKDASLRVLPEGAYLSSGYYDVSVRREADGWLARLVFRPFETVLKKRYQGTLFEKHVSEPRVFAAVVHGVQVGWVELGFDAWNNRMRVWEFFVLEEHRGKGIGLLLMKRAAEAAKERGARMLVLETQSNNAAAIAFYLAFGFELVGFDVVAYSNDDIERKEVRLELGLKIQ